jgi:NAD(P)-dependent dehydrogenase (short-subunit alcohol dehydrogenase family)
MRRLIDRCAGIDVGQALLVVCVPVVDEKGRLDQQTRSFGATTPDLLDLRDWLAAAAVTHVAMDAGVKLATVATDVMGVSGRDMMRALIAGVADPDTLAELAKARLQAKLPQLRRALTGRFRAHHAFLLARMLAHVEALEADIEVLSQRIAELARTYLRCAQPFAPGMMNRGWGRIISVSGLAARSTGSTIGSIRNVAAETMSKNLADELRPSGVNVTVVHQGTTRTEATPATAAFLATAHGVDPADIERRSARATTIGRIVDAAEAPRSPRSSSPSRSPLSVAVNGDAIACGGGPPGTIHY